MAKVHASIGEVELSRSKTTSFHTTSGTINSEKEIKVKPSSRWYVNGAKEQKLFSKFRRQQCSFISFVFFQFFCSFIFVANNTFSAIYYPTLISFVNLAVAVVCIALAGWVVVALKCVQKNNKYFKTIDNFWIPVFETLWLFGTCVSLVLIMTTVCSNGPCKDPDAEFVKTTGCSNHSLNNQMPDDLMVASLMFPFILSIIVKGVKWEFICLSFAVVVAISLFTMFYFDLTQSITTFVMFIPICMLAMYENQKQSVHTFLLAQSQQNLIEENERLAAETHATELRSMIGNVAHDLKTPLSAFINGMEILSNVCSELQKANQQLSSNSSNESTAERLSTFEETVGDIKNIHQFMLMTINRCIDYTKASQGLKLVPRLETISLLDTINLPLSCMKNLQNERITIELLSLPNSICPYVITDKQWLQENILCLLSNAVKYSTVGNVTVTVSYLDPAVASLLVKEFLASKLRDSGEEKEKNKKLLSSAIENSDKSGMLRFNIEDTGIGISPSEMDKLFNPFKQAQRLAGGTGLGLYSLAKRIESLGGCYGVQKRSDSQTGSLFWFSIPYRPDDVRLQAEQTPKPSLRISFSQHNQPNQQRDQNSLRISEKIPEQPTGTDNNKNNSKNDNSNSNTVYQTSSHSSDNIVQLFTASNAVESAENSTNIKSNSNSNTESGGRQQLPPLISQTIAVKTNTPQLLSQPQQTQQPSESLNILIVDDSLSILKMTSNLLRRNGHVISTVENGAEALDLLSSQKTLDFNAYVHKAFHVVLMDLQMPVMDGLESTRRLRLVEGSLVDFDQSVKTYMEGNSANNSSSDKVERNAEMKSRLARISAMNSNNIAHMRMLFKHQLIIGVSANSDHETMEAAFAAGIDAFIPKPFTVQSFRETYENLVEKMRKSAEDSSSSSHNESNQWQDYVI